MDLLSIMNTLMETIFVQWPPQMFIVMLLVALALFFYALEKITLEFTSLMVIACLMLLFHFAPIETQTVGTVTIKALEATDFLAGFANPALITILCMLILGEGLDKTGVLDRLANRLCDLGQGRYLVIFGFTLLLVVLFSALLNNTPMVVIMIPVMRTIARRARHSPSAFMMPLSYAAILGGMLTLIGSSTNLLVSAELEELGYAPLNFFAPTQMALILAGVGMLYIILVMPRILPDLRPNAVETSSNKRHFTAQIMVHERSPFNGLAPVGGGFTSLKGITLRNITRNRETFFPPFEFSLAPGDMIVIAGTKEDLSAITGNDSQTIFTDQPEHNRPAQQTVSKWFQDAQIVAEVIIPRFSSLIGKTTRTAGFRSSHHCLILGIQQKQFRTKPRLMDEALVEGDRLLIQGRAGDLESLRSNRDIVLLDQTEANVASSHRTFLAMGIFILTVLLIASGWIPVVMAAILGVIAMIAGRVLSIGDAVRALNLKIIMVISAALAMGLALQNTGGAEFIALSFFKLLEGASVVTMLSLMFLLISVLTNFLSNNASAVLFTPIAVALANFLNAPILPFVIAVLIAANCSFATPTGYQTNILVMGSGGYRFVDYIKAGVPLTLLCWLSFTFAAPLIWEL